MADVTNVPASYGQWGGHRTTKVVASVINITPGQWLARRRDEASGPSSFNEAKANALAMARGVPGDYFIDEPPAARTTSGSKQKKIWQMREVAKP